MQIHDEHPHESLTRSQIELLGGRSVDGLSAREKLDFANAAARPIPADPNAVRPEHAFRIDMDKIADADGMTKLRVANGADEMGRLRQRIAELASTRDMSADPTRRRGLEREIEMCREEARLLNHDIGDYELR